MNFTKRTEYALRALLEIGSAKKDVPVKRETIAKNQNLSSQFLEQVLIPLAKSKVIKSIRGPGGGFVLNKSPNEINTWDVFSSVEKTTKLYETNSKPGINEDFKVLTKIQSVWDKIDANLKDTMEVITLAELLEMEIQAKRVETKDMKSILSNYNLMQYVRTADEMCMSYQRQGRLYTFPPNLGQEAISTSTGFVMQGDDWLVPSYREVAAWILKGGSIKDIFLLWGGNEEGYLFSGAKNILPVSVPIASQLPHATGIGFALNYQGKDDAVFAFVGDGGTSEGDFHEALNFAGVWKVPVIFIIQNNQYAISVPVSKQTASKNLAIKSVAYGIPGVRVDGNDYLAMHRILTEAREYVTSGNGPILIEAVTYRKGAHTTSDDPSLYRTDEEELTWATKDPIKRLRLYLIKKKLWKSTDDEKLIEGYKKEVDAKFIEYENSSEYDLNDVFDHMYEDIPEDLHKQKIEYEKYLNWERGAK
jgi:pyruvate dehydrogenase E1 component alpha subunit